MGTRPSASAKVILPPRTVSLVVGAFYRLSTVFGGDFHVTLANFLSRVSSHGFVLLKTALEDVYQWLIETTKEHVRFGRERYPILPRTTFYLLTVSIAVLVFLLAVISAFPADGSLVAILLGLLEVVAVGTTAMFNIMSTTVMAVGTPEKDQGLLSYGMDYIKVSLIIFCSGDASLEVAEGS